MAPRLLLLPAAIAFLLIGCERATQIADLSSNAEKWSDSTQTDTTTTDVTAIQDADGRSATLLTAFFGLDDALPPRSDLAICRGAGGKDGTPVIFSHEIDVATMQAGDFKVVTRSGEVGELTCVTLAPADDPGELRTVLLAGHYGSAEDQPASVEIVGNLLCKDRQLNFKGVSISVIPLEEGPTLSWAEVVPEEQWELGKEATELAFGGGSGCPVGTVQVVRATWAGGITKPGGDEIDDKERLQYRVTLRDADGNESDVVPFAIGDLGDGDNNHELCLDQVGEPVSVQFPAGFVTDPREDLNPQTQIEVTRQSRT